MARRIDPVTMLDTAMSLKRKLCPLVATTLLWLGWGSHLTGAVILDPENVMALGTRRHDRADSLFTGLAATLPFAPVGKLLGQNSLCSATLIAPEWALTAAHCLDNTSFAASSYSFTVGGHAYSGAQKIVLPEWYSSGKDLLAGVDIALLKLSAKVTNVAPAILNGGFDELGKVGTHVGFGTFGTGLTGATGPAGTKRAGNNMIDVDGSFYGNVSNRILLDDFDSPLNANESTFGSSTPLDLEYLIAPGDSGGGLFANFGSGQVLVGVHSFLAWTDGTGNADYGDLSGSTRVASYRGWIRQQAGLVPEPSSVVMLGLGGIALVFVARKRAATARVA